MNSRQSPKACTIGLTGLRSGFAVSLFEGDRLLFAVEEDKLRRLKGTGIRGGDPRESLALAAALAFAGRGPEAVGNVVYTPPIDARGEGTSADLDFLRRFLERYHGIRAAIETVEHRRSQMAFAASMAPEAGRVLLVGKTGVAESAAEASDTEAVASFPIVGAVRELAGFLGLEPGRIHHLENMAQSGSPRFLDPVSEAVEAADRPVETLERILGKPRLARGDRPASEHFDIAASIQAVLIGRVRELVQSVLDKNPVAAMALCGGVFHSWSLNDALAEAFPDVRFSVSFAPGNAGCAIGGPIAATGVVGRSGPFLGPGYGRDEVKAVLDNCKARYGFHSQGDTIARVSDALAAGKMVGWFAGRCEFGLRALGARSVLTNPANPYACDNLSSYLKKRPEYMTYAVVTAEEASPISSPFMSRSTHLPEYFGDSAVRLQTASRSASPALHRLLGEFSDRVGVGALLNTSLNYFDEPIACTPRDAIKTFFASGLDMLAMEGFLLSK